MDGGDLSGSFDLIDDFSLNGGLLSSGLFDGDLVSHGDTFSLDPLIKIVELSSAHVIEFDELITIETNLTFPEEVVTLMELGGALEVKGLELVDGVLESSEEFLSGLEAVV